VRKVLHLLVPGTSAVVLGAGGLGSFAVQFLRALTPATVVAVDTNPERLRYASELGAHHVLEGVTPDTPQEIREVIGDGADVALDFVGIDATIAAGLASLRVAGAYGLIGAANGGFRGPWYPSLPRDGFAFAFQGSTIADVNEVVTLAAAGRIRSDVDLFGWDDVAEAYDAMEAGSLRGRAVVTPP
jgi:propanol-preferring alcohol dehydrogenase